MTYAEIAKERDDLKSENETLRAIMDKMLETGKALKRENDELKSRLEKAVEPPEPIIEQDKWSGNYRVYTSQIVICRHAEFHGAYDTIEEAEEKRKGLRRKA